MPEADKERKRLIIEKQKKVEETHESESQASEANFDFGGIPSDVSFNRNMGCGG